MKRYRVLSFAIDTSRNIFNANIPLAMKEKLKAEERQRLEAEYGSQNSNQKFDRWLSIPKPVLSVVGEHSHLIRDIERAYITGGLYPALTGACCLGERIFNHIILRTRKYYKAHPKYKLVHSKDSINDWNLGINTLKDWGIIDKDTEKKYKKLYKLRTESVHFQDKNQDLEVMAKESIELINGIVSDLFGIGPENKFINWCEVPGEMYLRKESEENPLVKEFYIPTIPLVGYKHVIDGAPNLRFIVKDKNEYEDKEISDAEFVRLRKEFSGKS